jgi:hypothetical protein
MFACLGRGCTRKKLQNNPVKNSQLDIAINKCKSEDPKLCSEALKIIFNKLKGDRENSIKLYLVKNGAVKIILQALQTHKEKELVDYYVLEIITLIANIPEGISDLMKEKAAQTLVNIIEENRVEYIGSCIGPSELLLTLVESNESNKDKIKEIEYFKVFLIYTYKRSLAIIREEYEEDDDKENAKIIKEIFDILLRKCYLMTDEDFQRLSHQNLDNEEENPTHEPNNTNNTTNNPTSVDNTTGVINQRIHPQHIISSILNENPQETSNSGEDPHHVNRRNKDPKIPGEGGRRRRKRATQKKKKTKRRNTRKGLKYV